MNFVVLSGFLNFFPDFSDSCQLFIFSFFGLKVYSAHEVGILRLKSLKWFKSCWNLWLPKGFPTSAHLSEIFVIFGETKTFPKFFKNFYCICHDLLILCFKKFISTFFFVCFLYCFHNSTTTTRKNSWC